GDHEKPTKNLAKQLGIDSYFSQALPEDIKSESSLIRLLTSLELVGQSLMAEGMTTTMQRFLSVILTTKVLEKCTDLL
ncbi:MAG: hypothetical protein D3907_04185, partial [Candidatus Electrothrix sp. AUS3]|nr:hypothetical protein [Candidatus Electrothrix gigas]